jgi:NADH-quinone oxidoreductase subunit J
VTPTSAFILYAIFAFGAAGLYLLLPQPGRSRTLIGGLLGLGALVCFFLLLGARVIRADSSAVFFYAFAAVAVAAAARVITHPKPVYSAVYFVLVVLAVAALLLVQEAEFLAVALVIIYAGAIMVTYLFVIMLAQQAGSPVYDRHAREPFVAVFAGFLLMSAIAGRAGDYPVPERLESIPVSASAPDAPVLPPEAGNTMQIGAVLMARYVVVVELGGVLLLVAMSGAVAMLRMRVAAEGFRASPRPVGQVGREVRPF